MSGRRLTVWIAVAVSLLASGAAGAVTLDEAIALAIRHDPGLKRVQAEQDAAQARVRQARAGGLPSVTVSGVVSEASTDFGPFFGFGQHTLAPRSAQITLEQPLYTGGAVAAAIGEAKAANAAAGSRLEEARLQLIADVAEAFEAERVAEQTLNLRRLNLEELALAADQASRRFQDGESPRTDVDQAQARLSGARADMARAQGDLARARARYRTLTGEEPVGLEASSPPPTPASLDDAVAQAQANNPSVAAAQSALRAAEAGVRRARAEGSPTLALVAEASTVRDQFLPGYRADDASIGVQGRWPLYAGGRITGKVSEAEANRRAAEAALDQVRAGIEEAALDAWQAVRTADAVAEATAAQARSAEAALDSVRHEVRVGAKPTLDLLDAEKEALAARISALQAQGARTVAAYRLKSIVGQ